MEKQAKARAPGRPRTRISDDPDSAAARFGAEVMRRREKAKLSGPELAEKAAVGATTIYDIEAGKATPTIAVVVRIDKALGLSGRLVSFAGALKW